MSYDLGRRDLSSSFRIFSNPFMFGNRFVLKLEITDQLFKRECFLRHKFRSKLEKVSSLHEEQLDARMSASQCEKLEL